jgi:hypothetical protein
MWRKKPSVMLMISETTAEAQVDVLLQTENQRG